MIRLIWLLLTLLFSLSSQAMGINSDFGRSSFAAKGGSNVKYIGKVDDLESVPRSQTFLDDLPDLGSPKANWKQNSSVVRKAQR